MGIKLDEREEMSVVALDGSIDISSAAELKTLLVRAIDAGKPVRVALDAATYLDVTAVQLLWAAERAAQQAGMEFAFAGGLPATLSVQLAVAGFTWFQAPVNAG